MDMVASDVKKAYDLIRRLQTEVHESNEQRAKVAEELQTQQKALSEMQGKVQQFVSAHKADAAAKEKRLKGASSLSFTLTVTCLIMRLCTALSEDVAKLEQQKTALEERQRELEHELSDSQDLAKRLDVELRVTAARVPGGFDQREFDERVAERRWLSFSPLFSPIFVATLALSLFHSLSPSLPLSHAFDSFHSSAVSLAPCPISEIANLSCHLL